MLYQNQNEFKAIISANSHRKMKSREKPFEDTENQETQNEINK